ncbi:DNA-binding protein [Caulobacter sp. Root655]|uniref:helix-turn-helix domain-containing transcriptional regulator n=1 Tax=Caulobacter sp. Root655 TaxID=1736578 RepID=UPI000A9A37BB|nr:hypothetical protein [Caulobacter sp. Root655]
METRPFDPAEYLDSEEAIAAYLADARAGGSAELSEATVVVARARAIMRKRRLSASSPSVRQEAVMAKNTGNDFRRGAVTGRTQFQQPNGDWQKRDERSGQFMERKSSEGPFKGVAKEPDGRDTKNS